MKEKICSFLESLQSEICLSLEKTDGTAFFVEDVWVREEGGGGKSKVIQNGNVFEKGGVNYSAVYGKAPSFLSTEKDHAITANNNNDLNFFATGISIVIHPKSPLVPIIHMNIRYFEMNNGTRWLGGGIDLTPIYIDKIEAAFFHQELKKVCDQFDLSYYTKFKKWADDYFFLPHRNEMRGVGGIFFDRLTSNDETEFEKLLSFWKAVGKSFAPIYTEIVNRKKQLSFTEQQKNFQYLRRGRYVEFNLVYDKGTKFGLETNGRIESILMSLPPHAGWQYQYKAIPNSEEERTLSLLKKGIDW